MADTNQEAAWAAQLRKGCLELAILASLWHAPLYGLEMLRTLQEAGMTLAEGTLYPILNRLRAEGLLESEWRDAGTGHPRKYYRLTDAGKKRTREMSGAWTDFSGQMNLILKSIGRKGASNGK